MWRFAISISLCAVSLLSCGNRLGRASWGLTVDYPVSVICGGGEVCDASDTSTCADRFSVTATTTGPLGVQFTSAANNLCTALVVSVFLDGAVDPVLTSLPLAPGDTTAFAVLTVAEGTHVLDVEASCANGTLGCWTGTLSVTTNRPPDCSQAAATVATLWPPNHKFVDVGVAGVTDPDGDVVTIAVTGVMQDEPTNSIGDGNTCPDASALGGATVGVRAERAGPGNGRVYHIAFTATDAFNATCTGEVTVCVPHDQGQGNSCVDDGALYDSTVCGDGDVGGDDGDAGGTTNPPPG